MSLVLRVLIGLIAGLLLGVGIASSHSTWLVRVPGWLDPVGTIFINAIRLAVIPIVVSGLIAGTASGASPATMGKLGRRSLALMLAVLSVSGLFGLAVGLPLFSFLLHPELHRPLTLPLANGLLILCRRTYSKPQLMGRCCRSSSLL